MKAGCRNGRSVELTNAASACPLSAASPAAIPCTGPLPRRGSSTTVASFGRSGRSWPAARTTTTGPFTARATIATVRPSSVDPCHSSAALGVPIREDRPPASTTPAQAITSPGYASRRIGRVRVAPDPAELPAGGWTPAVGRLDGYCGRVRVATWNVNSVKQRVPRLLPWLDERQPDVVCLQEIKLTREAFTELLGTELAARGYAFAVHGQAQWNGVAILSRAGLDDVRAGLPDEPGFPAPEARAVSASCGGVRVHSVYVPNGREPGSDHYRYKLDWLAALRASVAAGPEAALVCGDMNIAPADADVFDPAAYLGQTHVTPPERAALAELQAAGLHDVVRDRWPGN